VDKKTDHILFLIGLILCLIAIKEPSIGWVPLDYEFGLLQAVPLLFWAGIALMVANILLVFRNERYSFFIAKLFILFILLHNIPLFFTGNIYQPDALMSVQHSVSYTDSSAMMNYPADSTFFGSRYEAYTDWPLFFTGGAAMNAVLGTETLTFAIYFPLIASSLMFLSVACLFKLFLEDKWLKFALLLYVPLNVWLEFNYVPKALATPMFLLAFFCLSQKGNAWSLLTIIIMAYLVATHPITSLVMMLCLISLIFLAMIFRRLNPDARLQSGAGVNTVILFAVMFLSWMFFQANTTAGPLVIAFAESIANLKSFFLGIFDRFEFQTSLPWHYGPQIRFYVAVSFSFLSLLSMVVLVLKKREPEKLLFPAAIFTGSLLLLVLDFIVYAGFMSARYMLLMAITAPIFVALLLKNTGWHRRLVQVLCCLVIMVAALNFSVAYYRADVNIVSDTALATADYVSAELSNQVIVGPSSLGILHLPVFYHTRITGVSADDVILRQGMPDEDTIYAIILDRYSELYHATESYTKPEYYEYLEEKTAGLNRVYSNGSYEVYHTVFLNGHR
jgi:hypothetical protein